MKRKMKSEPHKTIEDRNSASIELMSSANIPKFNWTIDTSTGDIIVQSETMPNSVHLWHATTCTDDRRDFRMINLDSPCECGVAFADHCLNLGILWAAEDLEETFPGKEIILEKDAE